MGLFQVEYKLGEIGPKAHIVWGHLIDLEKKGLAGKLEVAYAKDVAITIPELIKKTEQVENYLIRIEKEIQMIEVYEIKTVRDRKVAARMERVKREVENIRQFMKNHLAR